MKFIQISLCGTSLANGTYQLYQHMPNQIIEYRHTNNLYKLVLQHLQLTNVICLYEIGSTYQLYDTCIRKNINIIDNTEINQGDWRCVRGLKPAPLFIIQTRKRKKCEYDDYDDYVVYSCQSKKRKITPRSLIAKKVNGLCCNFSKLKISNSLNQQNDDEKNIMDKQSQLSQLSQKNLNQSHKSNRTCTKRSFFNFVNDDDNSTPDNPITKRRKYNY